MENEYWTIDPEKDSNDYVLYGKEPDGWFSARIKWDGCVDLWRYFNTPMNAEDPDNRQLIDRIHICDIDDMIARLRALKKMAKENMPLFEE